ncbi:MAG: toll/interleukin-1 receptor domain-containing protein [Rubrivivax sp.]
MDGITVARLRLDISVAAGIEGTSTVEARAKASRTAFASYSSEDRQRVLDRVASARISASLDIFLDCMSLHPGEEWKPQLEREIMDRDLFLLFWSEHSARSEWVEWEWKTAYARKGRDALQIHPLSHHVQPPDELKDLHFGDPMMSIRDAQAAGESHVRP